MNRIDAAEIHALFSRQCKDWPLLRDNHLAFQAIQTRQLFVDGVEILVQFNPSRIVSSAAKVDSESIRKRKCFLCQNHLPPEQEYLSFGDEYLILCNPFPIFPEHFTVPTRKHVDQSIPAHMGDMLDLSRCFETYTVFYNGPRSGASAPDHMHFQIVTRNYMPIDRLDLSKTSLIAQRSDTELRLLTDYLRNGFIILSDDKEEIESLFRHICEVLETPAGETEPMMNIFCNYQEGKWIVKIIPRKQHRPSQYFAEGEERVITSPGAADIGGVFIASREEDYMKITPELLRDIYEQVGYGDEIKELFAHSNSNGIIK